MDVPTSVLNAYIALRAQYKFYIALERINGNYYVYRHKSLYDKETKKRSTESVYLGRITEQGVFLKRQISKEEKQLEIAKSVVEAHGGQISWAQAAKEPAGLAFTPTELDEQILISLSTDARESAAEIGRRLGVSPETINRRIKRLEETFGLKYTIDPMFEQFHYYRFVAIAKFIDERPDFTELQKVMEKDPRIRLVMTTRGAYDLFIFMYVNEPFGAEEVIYDLRSTAGLAHYKAEWSVSYYTESQGFIPFREEFFGLMKDRVWHRKKGGLKKQPGQFFYREYATVKELSQNSKMSFEQIDEKYGLKSGSARYTYNKLVAEGEIRHATITMTKPPAKDIAVIALKQIDIGSYNANMAKFFRYRATDEPDKPLNKFIFAGDLGSPYGILLVAPLYKDGDLERLEGEIAQIAKGTVIQTSIVSNTLVGNLGFRKIEKTRTGLHKRLMAIEEKEKQHPKPE
jgi:DNA-binding Lrp family transcriptional regulator